MNTALLEDATTSDNLDHLIDRNLETVMASSEIYTQIVTGTKKSKEINAIRANAQDLTALLKRKS